MKFYRNPTKRVSASTIKIRLHHGFGGGKLAGGKALSMQRMLWTNDCDVVMMGHTHITSVQTEAIGYVDRSGRECEKPKLGLWTGNWMGRARYADNHGYMPLPVGYAKLIIEPYREGLGKLIGQAIV